MQNGRLPLEGIRVLELASIVAGPFCGALMAEFGAEVIKTELPGRGDDLRRMGPSEGDCGYWWAVENHNKKVFTLDLHHPKGGPGPGNTPGAVFAGHEHGGHLCRAALQGTRHDHRRPGAHRGPLPQPAVVPRLSRTPGRVTHAGPTMGAHTEDVLSGLLGRQAEEIAALRREGVV